MATEAVERTSRGWARTLMTVLLVTLAALVALFAATVVAASNGQRLPWADPLLYNACFVLATAITALHAATGGRRARAWYLVSFGLGVYVLGRILFVGGDTVPIAERTVGFSDVFWLLFYPIAFVALLILTKRHLAMRITYSLLDSLLVGTGAFAVGVALLDAYLLSDFTATDSPYVVLQSLNLLGALVLVVLVLAMIQACNWRPPAGLWFLIAAGAVFSVALSVYLVQLISDTYQPGLWVDLLWPITALLISIGAYVDKERTTPPAIPQRLTFVAPSVAILAAGGVLIWNPPGPLEVVAVVAAAVTIVLAVVRLNIDVQESMHLSRQLRRARVDSLTGLPNRRSLQDLDRTAIGACAVVLVDLDGFKEFNNTMGHEAGDRLLVIAADRLRREVQPQDLVLRLEGDEFGVVLWGVDTPAAGLVAEALVRALEAPVSVDGVPLLITACAGVVASSEAEPDVDALLRRAAVPLATAKADGPGLVRMQQGDAGEQSAERLALRAEARRALSGGGTEFVVHYQPIVGVADGSLLSVEALVRWRRGDRLLQPGDFLADTMRGGQMLELTRLMMARGLGELRDYGLEVPVNINVPPELMTSWVVEEAARALEEVGAPPSRLIIEITEEAIMRQPEAVALVLADLRAGGVRVLLDDFGTGWSGLSSVRDLIVDGIKIDDSFVSRLAHDASAAAIVRSIATLAADLGLIVVYEGADDVTALEGLSGIGAGYVQSYAVGAPMPAGDLVGWIATRPVRQ